MTANSLALLFWSQSCEKVDIRNFDKLICSTGNNQVKGNCFKLIWHRSIIDIELLENKSLMFYCSVQMARSCYQELLTFPWTLYIWRIIGSVGEMVKRFVKTSIEINTQLWHLMVDFFLPAPQNFSCHYSKSITRSLNFCYFL